MSVHSCGPNCQEPLCVANRRIRELEVKVDELTVALTMRPSDDLAEAFHDGYQAALQAKLDDLSPRK